MQPHKSFATFIAENESTFIAAINNARFTSSLQNLTTMTINEFNCLRYIMAVSYGLDIWGWYVADEETNSVGIDNDVAEYNIIDSNTMNGIYPFCSKISKDARTTSLTEVYSKINESFGLFTGNSLVGFTNPLSSAIETMKSSISLTGNIPETMSTNINAILSFLHKDLKVITA